MNPFPLDITRIYLEPAAEEFAYGHEILPRFLASASMDELTTAAGLAPGALYHNFGYKKGLLRAVIDQLDAEMVAKARAVGERAETPWPAIS